MPFKQRTKFVPVKNKLGEQIGVVEINDTRRRWRALFWWIVIFTLIVAFSLYKTRTNSADAHDLKVSQCNIRLFLDSSVKFRNRSAAGHDKLQAKAMKAGKLAVAQREAKAAKQDRLGADLAERLADSIAPANCVKSLHLHPFDLTGVTDGRT